MVRKPELGVALPHCLTRIEERLEQLRVLDVRHLRANLPENLRERRSAQALLPTREVEEHECSRAIYICAQLRCPRRADILHPRKRRDNEGQRRRHRALFAAPPIAPPHRLRGGRNRTTRA